MKSLKTLITLAKIGRVLSKIVFIICIVGGALSVLGIIALSSMGSVSMVGGNLQLTMVDVQSFSMETAYAVMGIAVLVCAAEAVISGKAMKYFEHVLARGTPFTAELADELRDLGILDIAVSLGAVIVCTAALAALRHFFPDMAELKMEDAGSIGMGIAMIICSVFCRYGAELSERSGGGADALPRGRYDEKGPFGGTEDR